MPVLLLLALPFVGGLAYLLSKTQDKEAVDAKLFKLEQLTGKRLPPSDAPDMPPAVSDIVGHGMPTDKPDGYRHEAQGVQYIAQGRRWWAIIRGQECPSALEGARSESGATICAGTSECGVFHGNPMSCGGGFQWQKTPKCKESAAKCVFAPPALKSRHCYMSRGGRCDD